MKKIIITCTTAIVVMVVLLTIGESYSSRKDRIIESQRELIEKQKGYIALSDSLLDICHQYKVTKITIIEKDTVTNR